MKQNNWLPKNFQSSITVINLFDFCQICAISYGGHDKNKVMIPDLSLTNVQHIRKWIVPEYKKVSKYWRYAKLFSV